VADILLISWPSTPVPSGRSFLPAMKLGTDAFRLLRNMKR
jgi:hypothetical protein